MKEVYSGRRSSHSMTALVCGLDVHKESIYATILDLDGEVITQRRMPNGEVPDFLRPHRLEKDSHGGLHQHHTPLPEAHRGGIRRHGLPSQEDPVHSGGPHQIGPSGLKGTGGAPQAQQSPRELHAPARHRRSPGEGECSVDALKNTILGTANLTQLMLGLLILCGFLIILFAFSNGQLKRSLK